MKLKAFIAVALCAAQTAAMAAEYAADTVVYGTIRTAEADHPVAAAIAIKDGKYVYVGDEVGAAEYIQDGVTEVVDHRGKGMVMPGCTDGHAHYAMQFSLANMKGGILFDETDDKDTVLAKLAEAAFKAKEAGKKTLFGFGWDYYTFRPSNGPTLKDLDAATPGVSAVILDSTGHGAYCNSECLKNCGIIDGEGNVLIRKIDGGLLELDENGYPTGYVDERVTGYLMRMGGIDADDIIDDEVAETALRASQDLLLSTGYTIALEGWSNVLHPSKFYEVAKRLDEDGDLKLVFPMTYEVEPWMTDMTEQIEHLASLKKTYGTGRVLPDYLKIFMDGCVETKTGAMLKRYTDGTEYKSFWSVDRLADITANCNARGLTVHIHVMGDAAVRDATDAYVRANEKRGDNTSRNCLVHLRSVAGDDFKRFADNNIACSAGFTWHVSSKEMDDLLENFLDDEYIKHAYPMKSFFDAGVKVSSHSDFPANEPSPQDPFGIMQVALTGMVPNPAKDDKPFDTDELVTIEQVFQALTLNGAWQLGLEDERGSIKVGKYADFVLADKDVFNCRFDDISKTKVVSTWFEGEKVYQAGSEKNPWKVGKTADDTVFAYTNGTDRLVVRGLGGMADFTAANPAPWGTWIVAVDFGAQVTNFGANAFVGCAALTMRGNPPAIGAGNDLSDVTRIVIREDALVKFEVDPDWSAYAEKFESIPVCYDWQNVKTLTPFLHEVRFKEEYDSPADGPYAVEPENLPAFSCTAVRNGNFYGRNFDYYLSDIPSFVVRMPARHDSDPKKNRLASVGVAAQDPIREDGVTNGQYTASYDTLPEVMYDGINECGVIMNVNVVPRYDCGKLKAEGTNPEGTPLHIAYLIRYVLDHATNATHAIELANSRNLVGNGGPDYLLHWMVADPEETYVVEIVNNKVVARHMDIISNFNWNWDNENGCPVDDAYAATHEGWGRDDYPVPYSNDVSLATINRYYTPRSDGLERFCVVREHYDEGATFDGMSNLLRRVQYTRMADTNNWPIWLSDFTVDDAVTIPKDVTNRYDRYRSNDPELTKFLTNKMSTTQKVFAHKEENRKLGLDEWQTVHNTTYDIENRMFRIAVQEDYEHTFDIWLNGLPGNEKNPWKIGTEDHEAGVIAWTNGTGTLLIEGAGAVGSMPWAESADGIAELLKDKAVAGLEGIMATLPDLANVNGLTLDELASAGMLGAVKATGFSAIAVKDGVATLSVVIGKAETLDEPEWKPVSTNDIPVEADSPAGFFIVAPQMPSDLDLPPIVTVK